MLEKRVHITLRVAIAMCFIGHGTFGVVTKPIWCNYFAVFGIGHDMACRLMPLLGAFDILAGLVMLVCPIRAIPLWLVIWGLVTAALRPLSGEPFAEFIERAGNFGAPLVFLLLAGTGGGTLRGWFTPASANIPFTAKSRANIMLCLRVVVFLLLLGHGWLNVIGKKGLLSEYTSIGFSNPAEIALSVGIFEIIAACTVLIRPWPPVLLVLLVWKMGSELFYPHYEVFEWVERGGSYGSLLALGFMTRKAAPARYMSLAT